MSCGLLPACRNVSDLLHLDPHSSWDMLEEEDAEKVEESDSQEKPIKIVISHQIYMTCY
jgi:hypothetical protein